MTTRAASAGRIASPSWGFYVWLALLALLMAQGLYSFYRQTFEGHYLTGLTDLAPWGIYIAGVVFFIGASAGATIVGLMIHAFGREDYAPLGTRAILVGFVSLVAAILFVTVDVGSIPRMLNLPFVWRNPTSPFMYTSLSYYIFGLLLLGELYYAVKANRGVATVRDKKIAKWLAIAVVPYALVVVHAITGSLFAVVKAREFWNSPLLPPHFAVAALLSGTAIILLVALITSQLRGRALVGKKTLAHMGTLLAFFIGLAGFLDFFDFLVFTYSDVPTGIEAWRFLVNSHLPLSILHVGGLILAFVILLFKRGRETPWLAVAAVVAIVATAAYRYNLTTVGLAVPLFPFLSEEHYTPTWTEFSLVIGIVAAVLFSYTILARVLPMEEVRGAS